ncbi:MAG: colanic acid/amylovoran biosynthesis glycosyltransferase [Verrucomicrobiales bacterium]|jgi:colanic acid/amylovoran biosynthesis glycosyltransferase
MLHIYRQVTGLQNYRTFVIAQQRQSAEKFPFDDIEITRKPTSNFVRRFWLKYVKHEPPIVYRGEYGVLEKILSSRSADLMHVYFGHTGVHLLPFIQRWPKPTIVSFHGMDVQPRADRPGYVEKLGELVGSLPLVLARSHSLRERLIDLGCPAENIRINRTGIPMDLFAKVERTFPSDGAWKLVQACRLIEKKGLDVALKAFAEFAKDYPLATFTIAGEGPLLQKMQALAGELGISEKVHFPGFLSENELRELFGASHLFVHPSQLTEDQNQEGVPNAMLEAMATGLPVAATLHGGIPEAVINGETGLLVPERDVLGLTHALRSFAESENFWQKFCTAAAADVRQNFEQSAQVKKLESFYDEAVATLQPRTTR